MVRKKKTGFLRNKNKAKAAEDVEEVESDEDGDEDEEDADEDEDGDEDEENGDEDEEDAEDEDGDDDEDAEDSDDEKGELTKAEKAELFKAYQEQDDAVRKLEADLEKAKKQLSEVVQHIGENCGPGPFRWRGRELRVVSRKGNYYMRGPKGTAEEIG